MRAWLLALVAAGCGTEDLVWPVDAPPAPVDAAVTVADNSVRTGGKPVVYLVFDGVFLENSFGAPSDARVNRSQFGAGWVTPIKDQAWADAFAANLGPRLAALGIPMELTRPASGDYTMFAFNGSGGATNGRWKLSADCDFDNPNDIVIFNEDVFNTMDPEHGASLALYALGMTIGLDEVMAQQNCMALVLHETCTFADGVITRDEPCGSQQQDQRARVAELFGCP